MPETAEPEQITLMKRVVELAERQTQLSEERTRQSAERSYLNAERTLSVWTRTSLSLMIFGIAVDRFGLLLRHAPWGHLGTRLLPNPLSTLGGVLLIVLGVFVVMSCGLRYLAYAKAHRAVYPWPEKHAPYLALTFAMLVAAFGVVLIVILLAFTWTG